MDELLKNDLKTLLVLSVGAVVFLAGLYMFFMDETSIKLVFFSLDLYSVIFMVAGILVIIKGVWSSGFPVIDNIKARIKEVKEEIDEEERKKREWHYTG